MPSFPKGKIAILPCHQDSQHAGVVYVTGSNRFITIMAGMPELKAKGLAKRLGKIIEIERANGIEVGKAIAGEEQLEIRRQEIRNKIGRY